MSLESFYESIGANLGDVRGRLQSDDTILKFVGFFLQDDSFANLESALAAGDLAEAFRAAHSLKGVAQNMSFTALYEAASALTEALRPDDSGQPKAPEQAPQLMEDVRAAYERIAAAAEDQLGDA